MPQGVFRKFALLTVRDMMRDVPHMEPYRNGKEYWEVVELLGELGTAPGNEAVVKLTDWEE